MKPSIFLPIKLILEKVCELFHAKVAKFSLSCKLVLNSWLARLTEGLRFEMNLSGLLPALEPETSKCINVQNKHRSVAVDEERQIDKKTNRQIDK